MMTALTGKGAGGVGVEWGGGGGSSWSNGQNADDKLMIDVTFVHCTCKSTDLSSHT